MTTIQDQDFQISIWGKFPECPNPFGNDFLWHDTVKALPALGSVLLIDDTLFQVHYISIDTNLDEDSTEPTYIIDVRPYSGSIPPYIIFSYPEP